MTDFGTRLKIARKNRKMTQKVLAQCLGVEQSTISNYETNFRFPDATTLTEIADQLQISVDYLLGRSELQESNITPEASLGVSGSLSIDAPPMRSEFSTEVSKPFRALQKSFLEYLKQGQLQEATELIMNYKSPETKLLDYYENVFDPILKEVGELWAAGIMSVADEHMISAEIDKVMTRLEQVYAKSLTATKPYAAVLMLPGAEEHEFPIKMMTEVFKRHGWTTYYLGKSIPISSLEDFFKKKKIHVLVLSVTLSNHLNSCEALIRAIRTINAETQPKIIVGGSAVENEDFALNQLGADFYLKSLQALDKAFDDIEDSIK